MSTAADREAAEAPAGAPESRGLRIVILTLGLGYLAAGLWLMVDAAPKVPYADSYRFLATFLELPFPADVLSPDNGHREIVTNGIRVLELELFAADQRLQIGVGFGLLLVVWLALGPLRDGTDRTRRTAAAGLLLLGMFWLGNWRKLTHGSEVMHLTFVLLSLVLGLRSLAGRTERGAVTAGALGIFATLCFGSGPACFGAFFALLLVQRAPWRHWLWVAIGAGLAAAALLGTGEPGSAVIAIAPLEQLVNLLHLLGAPFVWVFAPLLDTAHAARLPGPFADLAGLVAEPVEAWCGPRLQARWPAVGFGALGLAGLLWQTAAAWQQGATASRAQRVALGLMWFGATVPALIAAARLGYFRNHPEQLTTQRYGPWIMVFWTGLAWRLVLRPGAHPRRMAWLAVGVLVVFLPSQMWNARNAYRQQTIANLTAAGAATGVLDRELSLNETMPDDLLRATPLLRAADAAMFAWPETALLGTKPNVTTSRPTVSRIEPVDNLFDGPGCSVMFEADVAAARLLLLDSTGTARGIAVHVGPQDRWHGFMQGPPPPDDIVRFARLD